MLERLYDKGWQGMGSVWSPAPVTSWPSWRQDLAVWLVREREQEIILTEIQGSWDSKEEKEAITDLV